MHRRLNSSSGYGLAGLRCTSSLIVLLSCERVWTNLFSWLTQATRYQICHDQGLMPTFSLRRRTGINLTLCELLYEYVIDGLHSNQYTNMMVGLGTCRRSAILFDNAQPDCLAHHPHHGVPYEAVGTHVPAALVPQCQRGFAKGNHQPSEMVSKGKWDIKRVLFKSW
jgi:hypothetical protein